MLLGEMELFSNVQDVRALVAEVNAVLSEQEELTAAVSARFLPLLSGRGALSFASQQPCAASWDS